MTVERSTISRRRALSGAATAGLGLPLLAACGDGGGGESTANAPSSKATRKSDKPTQTESSASEPPGDGIPTADVPVGGGIVLSDEQVVITQPTAGDFHAFTAVCTHAQCLVTAVSDGTINCPCHGSQYAIEEGSVVGGPAPAPLAEVEITVKGDKILTA
jgi:Rieske Fe-S protein